MKVQRDVFGFADAIEMSALDKASSTKKKKVMEILAKPTSFKSPKKRCCKSPDVKNEGYVDVPKGRVWEYHCYNCQKSWTEVE